MSETHPTYNADQLLAERHAKITPEQHTSALADSIDIEIDRYGVASLADFCASTIDGRADDARPDYAYWSDVRKVFEAAGEQLLALNRKHGVQPPVTR